MSELLCLNCAYLCNLFDNFQKKKNNFWVEVTQNTSSSSILANKDKFYTKTNPIITLKIHFLFKSGYKVFWQYRAVSSVFCQENDFGPTPTGYAEVYGFYAYYCLKLLDLFDTVRTLMILLIIFSFSDI